jgi:hypothetical protein
VIEFRTVMKQGNMIIRGVGAERVDGGLNGVGEGGLDFLDNTDNLVEVDWLRGAVAAIG